jgi:predicted MFS family arabinose efflux permease
MSDDSRDTATHRVGGKSTAAPWWMLGLVVASTVLGLMGTDLVLPAVPYLPETLGGTITESQLVLAAYVGGTCLGLLAYGALGDRFSTHRLFVGSLFVTAAVSLACAVARDIHALVALRALRGAAAAGPAVFAPGIVRASFDERGAVHALGRLGSIEALAPALAPMLGIWLVALGGWPLTFVVLGCVALLLAATVGLSATVPQITRRPRGGYAGLLIDPVFLRYALSQALVLGGLLVFVFGMPTIFVHVLDAGLRAFVVMQVCGIASFMLAANAAGRLAERFGADRMIWLGSLLAALGSLGLLAYGLLGGRSGLAIAALFIPLNAGLGLRGPPGFFRAVVAARGDDARGAALVILFILGITTAGTTVAAPLLLGGIAPLAGIACGLQLLALLCLALLPPLPGRRLP